MESEQEYIELGDRKLPYTVVRSKRASKARIKVGVDGVEVVIPARVHVDPRALLLKNARWVLRHSARYREIRASIPRRTFEEGARFPLLGNSLRLKIARAQKSYLTDLEFVLAAHRVEQVGIRDELERLYRRIARRHFTDRVEHFAAIMGVDYGKIQIRNQKTRWGSYSQRTGTLSLNWRLMMAPPEIVDYLLVHELAHAEVPNHSRRFWRLVEQYVPDYREKDAWLEENGVKLVF